MLLPACGQTYLFLALWWASGVIAYTPCSYDAWVEGYQSCMLPCFGEQFYDELFNTAKCGNYSTGSSSTKRSHVKCLCETASFTIKIENEREACIHSHCNPTYNATLEWDNGVNWGNMCLWARGGMWPLSRSLEPGIFADIC